MKNTIPAREQIQALTDGLTGINYTACVKEPSVSSCTNAWCVFPILAFLNACSQQVIHCLKTIVFHV